MLLSDSLVFNSTFRDLGNSRMSVFARICTDLPVAGSHQHLYARRQVALSQNRLKEVPYEPRTSVVRCGCMGSAWIWRGICARFTGLRRGGQEPPGPDMRSSGSPYFDGAR